MVIIGVLGFKGSGKSTFGKYIQNKYKYKELSFASSLKDAISPIFGWDRQKLEGISQQDREFRETEDVFWAERLGVKCTPRWVMQNLGTDVIRKYFNNNIWIYSLERKLEEIKNKENVVITDVRFPDEIDFLKRKGAILVYIEREDSPEWFYDLEKVPKDLHISEWAWVEFKPKICIKNKGTKEMFYNEIENTLEKYLN